MHKTEEEDPPFQKPNAKRRGISERDKVKIACAALRLRYPLPPEKQIRNHLGVLRGGHAPHFGRHFSLACRSYQRLARSAFIDLTFRWILRCAPNGRFRFSDWANDIPLPDCRKTRGRWNGRCLQGRGYATWPLCCSEV